MNDIQVLQRVFEKRIKKTLEFDIAWTYRNSSRTQFSSNDNSEAEKGLNENNWINDSASESATVCQYNMLACQSILKCKEECTLIYLWDWQV